MELKEYITKRTNQFSEDGRLPPFTAFLQLLAKYQAGADQSNAPRAFALTCGGFLCNTVRVLRTVSRLMSVIIIIISAEKRPLQKDFSTKNLLNSPFPFWAFSALRKCFLVSKRKPKYFKLNYFVLLRD